MPAKVIFNKKIAGVYTVFISNLNGTYGLACHLNRYVDAKYTFKTNDHLRNLMGLREQIYKQVFEMALLISKSCPLTPKDAILNLDFLELVDFIEKLEIKIAQLKNEKAPDFFRLRNFHDNLRLFWSKRMNH